MQCPECNYISFKNEKACGACGFKLKKAKQALPLVGKESFSIFAGSEQKEAKKEEVSSTESISVMEQPEPESFIDSETGEFNLDLPDIQQEEMEETHASPDSEVSDYEPLEFDPNADIDLGEVEVEGLGLEPSQIEKTTPEEMEIVEISAETPSADEETLSLGDIPSLEPTLEITEPDEEPTLSIDEPALEITEPEEEPTLSIDEPALEITEPEEEPTLSIDEPALEITEPEEEPTLSIDEPALEITEPEEEPTLSIDEPALEITEPEEEPTLSIGEPALEITEPDEEPTLSIGEPALEITEPDEEPTLSIGEPALEIAEPESGLETPELDLGDSEIKLDLGYEPPPTTEPDPATLAAQLDTLDLNLEIDDSEGPLNTNKNETPEIEIEDLGLELEDDTDKDKP